MTRVDKDLRLSHAVRIFSSSSFFFILSNTRSEFSFSPNYSVFKQFLAVQYFLKWIETWAHLWQGMEKLLFNSHSRVVPFPEVHKVSLVRMRCWGEKAVLIIHSGPWTSICFWIGTLTWDQQPVICSYKIHKSKISVREKERVTEKYQKVLRPRPMTFGGQGIVTTESCDDNMQRSAPSHLLWALNRSLKDKGSCNQFRRTGLFYFQQG